LLILVHSAFTNVNRTNFLKQQEKNNKSTLSKINKCCRSIFYWSC